MILRIISELLAQIFHCVSLVNNFDNLNVKFCTRAGLTVTSGRILTCGDDSNDIKTEE